MRQGKAFSFAMAAAGASGMIAVAAGILGVPSPARAEECPGNPDALGTSRVLEIDPAKYPKVGIMQYPQSLPLADKEVVITFDDGPLPRYSDKVLDILASQCVKVTYFLVGIMARAYPDSVRREAAAGHTIGTHSQDHPNRFQKLSPARVQQEIDQGIASVAEALGDPTKLAPFFRIPGLAHTPVIEDELAGRSLVTFSSDVVADDWRHIGPGQIVTRAMQRLNARGKGILLLHDIHAATLAALPALLKQLKDQGFHIVHVVPAHASPATPEAPVVAAPAAGTAAAGTATSGTATTAEPAKDASTPPPQPAAVVAEPAAAPAKDVAAAPQPAAATEPVPAQPTQPGTQSGVSGTTTTDAVSPDLISAAHNDASQAR